MKREAIQVGLPQGATITRHHHQDAPALAQEILDQDGAYALWSVLHASGEGEHHYVARDANGNIHGLLTGSEDGPNHFMHDLRTSQNAPAGVGAAMVQAAARDAKAGNRKLRAMGVMDSARHWWEAMGLKLKEGDENGEFAPDTLDALLAGNTTELPNTKVYKNTPMGKYPVPVDPDVRPWIDPARRAPGSARALQVAASTIEAAQRLLAGAENDLQDVYHLQKDDLEQYFADQEPIKPSPPVHQPAKDILNEWLQQRGNRSRRDITVECPSCRGTGRHHLGVGECNNCDGKKVVTKPEVEQKMLPWAERLENALYDEFNEWWPTSKASRTRSPETVRTKWHDRPNQPLTHWLNIEDFLKERYPEAATGGTYGGEDAGRIINEHLKSDRPGKRLDPKWLEQNGYVGWGNPITQAMLTLHNRENGRYWRTKDDRRKYFELMLRHIGPKAPKPRKAASILDAVEAIRLAQQVLGAKTQNGIMADETIERLRGEFSDWWEKQNQDYNTAYHAAHFWPNIETFLKDRYPAAHRGLDYGYEQARPLLKQKNDREWGDVPDADPYNATPEEIAKYGYDPAEIAAGMLYLHNDRRSGRQSFQNADRNLLMKVIRKRHQMQKEYDSKPRQLELPLDLEKAAAAIREAQQILAGWHTDPNFFGAVHEMAHVLDAVTGFKASATLHSVLVPLYMKETGTLLPPSYETGTPSWQKYNQWLKNNLPRRGWETRLDYITGNPSEFFYDKEAIASAFVEHELNPSASTPAMRALHQHLVDMSAKAGRPTNLTTFRLRAKPPKDIDPEDGTWPTGKLPRAFIDGIQHVFQKYPQSRIVDMVEPLEMSKGGHSPVTNTVLKTLDSKPRIEYDDRAALAPKLVDDMFHRQIENLDVSPWMWQDDTLSKAAAVLKFAEITAAKVRPEIVTRLGDEFKQWWDEGGKDRYPKHFWYDEDYPTRGPIGYWRNVEEFLKTKYPAAHRSISMGQEEARHLLDGSQGDENGLNMLPYNAPNTKPYATGPEAVAEHGYDPREIASAMLLLHNESHPLRGYRADEDQARLDEIAKARNAEFANADIDVLHDIAQKRQKMQENADKVLATAAAVLKINWDDDPLLKAASAIRMARSVLAGESPTLMQLHRGVGFQKGELPPEMEQRFEQAAAGQADPNFIKDLLLHLDRDGGGMGEFWAHGKEGPWLAQTYSARVWPDKWTNLPSHYRVLLDADWDGSESDMDFDTDPDYRKLLPGAKVRVRNIKIRTPKHDWIDLGGEPEGSVRYAMLNQMQRKFEQRQQETLADASTALREAQQILKMRTNA